MTDRIYPEAGANRNGFPRGPKGAYTNLKSEKSPFQGRPPSQSARPPYYNDGYNGRPRRRGCCCRCLGWSCLVFLLIVVLLGIATLVFYLVVRPKAPKYNVEDVRLTNFAIAPSTLTTGTVNLNVTTLYSVEARNPNKRIGIYYDTINIHVQSEGATIGRGSVPPFYQGHRNTTIIAGQLNSQDLPLVATVGNALQSAQTNGKIPLVVYVDVRVRVKVGSIKTPRFWVHVRCNVEVNPNATGSQVLSKKCKVKR